MTKEQVERASPNSAVNGQAASANWNILQRILFRLIFSYLMLYSLPSLLGFACLQFFVDLYKQLWQAIIYLVSEHVFHVSCAPFQFQGGDTTANYIEIFCLAVLSLFSTLIWSIIDRKRQNYNRLYSWFRFCMRIFLGANMISFGWVKVIGTQFPPLDLIRLSRPLCNFSPAGLLWACMGYSYPFTAFGGVAEVLAGILLLLPTCELAGAFLSFAVMLNVVMFDMCFDVGLRIFAFHLLLTAVVLLLPEWKGLLNYFFLRRDGRPVCYAPLFSSTKFNKLATLFLILYCVYFLGYTAISDTYVITDMKKRQESYSQRGIWIVQDQTIDGTPAVTVNDPELHWGRLVFDRGSDLVVQDCTGKRTSYQVNLENKTAKVSRDNIKVGEFQFVVTAPDHATIDGTFTSRHVHCSLKAFPEKDIVLTSGGFHWINDGLTQTPANASEKYGHNR